MARSNRKRRWVFLSKPSHNRIEIGRSHLRDRNEARNTLTSDLFFSLLRVFLPPFGSVNFRSKYCTRNAIRHSRTNLKTIRKTSHNIPHFFRILDSLLAQGRIQLHIVDVSEAISDLIIGQSSAQVMCRFEEAKRQVISL